MRFVIWIFAKFSLVNRQVQDDIDNMKDKADKYSYDC